MRSASAVLAGCLLAILFAGPAFAHAVLVATTPAPGRVLASPPTEVVLVFSEAVTPVVERTSVVGPGNTRVDLGAVRDSGTTVRLGLRGPLPPGTYVVSYRAVSVDGQPAAGEFDFIVGRPSSAPPRLGTGGVAPLTAGVVVALRWLGYLGLALLVGPALFLPAARRLCRTGAVLVAVSAVGGLVAQVPYTGADLSTVLGSRTGIALVVRLALVAVVPALLSGRWGKALPVVLAALALTWPLAGHPGVAPVPALAVVTDLVHLGGMSVWLGGLAAVLAGAVPEASLGARSRWTERAIAAVVLSGTVEAVVQLGPPVALLTTGYGRLVLVKVALAALAVGVAARARRRFLSRRLIAGELAIGTVAVLASALLGSTVPGREAVLPTATATLPYAAELDSPGYRLRVQIDPARVGPNVIHLYAVAPDGGPLPVLGWDATARSPVRGPGPIAVPLRRITLDHETADIVLPTAGRWEFRFTLRPDGRHQATVVAVVPVAP